MLKERVSVHPVPPNPRKIRDICPYRKVGSFGQAGFREFAPSERKFVRPDRGPLLEMSVVRMSSFIKINNLALAPNVVNDGNR